MKKAGIILVVIGCIVTVFTGLNFVTKEKVVDIGELEVRANKNHSLSWSPLIGIIIIAAGAGCYMLSTKK
jgi:hypothetical protein